MGTYFMAGILIILMEMFYARLLSMWTSLKMGRYKKSLQWLKTVLETREGLNSLILLAMVIGIWFGEGANKISPSNHSLLSRECFKEFFLKKISSHSFSAFLPPLLVVESDASLCSHNGPLLYMGKKLCEGILHILNYKDIFWVGMHCFCTTYFDPAWKLGLIQVFGESWEL